MNNETYYRLKKAEKLIDAAEFEEASDIIQSLEILIQLSKEEKLSVLVLKLRCSIFQGNYDEALQLSTDFLLTVDSSKPTSITLKLLQINAIVLRADALARIGRFKEGLKTLEKAQMILNTINPNDTVFARGKVVLLTEKGFIFVRQMKMNQALDVLKKSLILNKRVKSQRSATIIHNTLGLTYLHMGELDLAFRHYDNCLTTCKAIGNKIYMRFAYANIAEIYMLKGELDLALERYLEVIDEIKKSGDKINIANITRLMGNLYRLKGDYDSALKYYKQSLKLRKEVGNRISISESLCHLIILTIDNNTLEQSQKYLQQLQTLYEEESNEVIRQRYHFAQAIITETSKRANNLVIAQKILKEIADKEIIDSEHAIFTLISLCKFLLEEIRLFGNEEAILELKSYASKFFEISQKQNSLILLTEAYVLQSRIALIDQDLIKAKELLEQASVIAKEKKLDKISLEIAREKAFLMKQMETGKKYQLQNASLKERIKLAQLDDIITRIVHGKTSEISKQKEELSDFAHQMAHDLRRNITNILGFSELIKNRGYNERLIKIIIKNSGTMRELLTHSVELADAGLIVQTIDEVDLSHLVESVALIHLQSDIVLTHNNLPILVCDRNKVSQIFKNLFENAVLHGKTTKTISITRIDDKDKLTLLISNDGLPIPIDINKKVFQRGYTTKKGNTGLGLTIVKKLVEAHGWEISLDPSPITTFRISIPIRLHTEQKIIDKAFV